MIGTIWKDATGKEFNVRIVDHTMDGTWVHYVNKEGEEFSCLIDAFKERFKKMENTKR